MSMTVVLQYQRSAGLTGLKYQRDHCSLKISDDRSLKTISDQRQPQLSRTVRQNEIKAAGTAWLLTSQ